MFELTTSNVIIKKKNLKKVSWTLFEGVGEGEIAEENRAGNGRALSVSGRVNRQERSRWKYQVSCPDWSR